ncbi:carbohydrate esterase family 16 protein [Trametes coccinea BRFM310]|uniref:Carbohydrate esterase family 16 protein n=1 Tax=Trametes coccinea (strain BRFM310) TaxID=1353009 RepID=A0A1Y2I7J8_TRAC3|nr:carbohydrate esterase family 16 protein [Trametes coccinea BRFM310]
MAASDPNTIRPSWRGFNKIRHLIVFGDSYSDVGYEYNKITTYPTDDAPLGIEFPGITWAEPAMPNWVGYLVTEYSPGTKLLVYDYAVGGHTVEGVRKQVQVNFLPRVGGRPNWACWSAEDTLFVTWIGINDCARLELSDIPATLDDLFAEQELLYETGARNFLFIDVPPIDRSPVGVAFTRNDPAFKLPYETWNSSLRSHVTSFVQKHPDVTTFVFSSWATFTRVLDDPVAHGFREDHASRAGGDIWVDNLHPSSRMHDWIAHDVSNFLQAQPAYSSDQVE